MKIKHLLLMLLFSCLSLNAQDILVKGKVRNIENMVVNNVSIVIYVNKTIRSYDFTNDEGKYTIKLKDVKLRDSINIMIKGLGYESISQKSIFNGQLEIIQDFILEEKVEMLNEVILEAWEKLKISTDTVTFRAANFMKGSEQVVEDLLKNLPSVEVLKDGNIKVNGKSIDKLLIEGDDLFDDKYKLLSKNLDAKNISEVQILNNFEDNPVLKDFQESEKVAINLKLKKDRKNVWFGNASLGIGTNSRHTGSANLGLIKQKIKLFNLASLNNTRRLSVSQVKHNGSQNISSFQTQDKIEKDNNTIVNIDNLSNPNLSDNEDVFNDSFLNSLSFMTNLSETVKLRSLSYYAQDKITKENSNLVKYFTLPKTIEFSEERKIAIEDAIFGTDLEIKYHVNNKTYVKYDFSFENNPIQKNGNFLSNQNAIYQVQKDKKHNLYNHLNITKKLSDNNLLSVYAYYGLNNTKQNFFSESNVLDREFDDGTPQSHVKQNSTSPLNYMGVITELITKIKKSEFGLELLGSFDYDKINSALTFDDQPPVDSLSNNTNYKKTLLSATGKYNLNISDQLKLKSSINISQNYTSLNNDKEAMFFINPKIGLTYKRSLSVVFDLNYSFTNNLPSIYYLNENYILKNYRTFSKGLDHIVPTKSHNISFRYAYKNYKNLFLINSFALYSFSDSNYATDNLLSETYSFNSYKILNGGDAFSYNLGITKYLNNVPVSVKLDTHQSWSSSNVIINSNYGKVKNYSSSYRLQGNTYLKIPLNFRFHFQYNYSNGQLNNQKVSNKYLETSLSSVLELSSKWIVEMTNDYYSIKNTNFLFNNMKINFNPEKSRWSYMLIANNLSNINGFSNAFISDYQESISNFKIVPRYIILDLKYRF